MFKRLNRAAGRALNRLVNGVSLIMDDGATPMANTSHDTLLEYGKLRLYHYPAGADDPETHDQDHSTSRRRFAVPVLMVPPLMVQHYIYDLRPDHSIVRAFQRAGFDPYVVDFGAPDKSDAAVRLDDYVLDYLPRAIAAVRKHHGTRDLTLVGYCMGGIFSLLYTAAHEDEGIRNIVAIAAPIDFAKMGVLQRLASKLHDQVQLAADHLGNVPGAINSNALKMIAPVKRVTRYADLFLRLYDDEYVRGFDATRRWANDFIDYPQAAFKQFMTEVMVENRLLTGMRFGDRDASLARVRASVLAFAGRDDNIATLDSARAIVQATGSKDLSFVEVAGGHIGVIIGGKAPQEVWRPAIAWLRPRSLAR